MNVPAPVAPMDCPKWDACSAPLCPFDDDWCARVHLPGERACFYLLECGKPGGEARIRGALPGHLADRVVAVYPAAQSRCSPLRKRLRDASSTPSRLGRQPGRPAA